MFTIKYIIERFKDDIFIKKEYEIKGNKVIITPLMDFEKEAMNITNNLGVDVVYDSEEKDTFERSLKCLKKRGTLVLFGNSSGNIENFDVSKLGGYGPLFLTRPSILYYLSSSEEIKSNSE